MHITTNISVVVCYEGNYKDEKILFAHCNRHDMIKLRVPELTCAHLNALSLILANEYLD